MASNDESRYARAVGPVNLRTAQRKRLASRAVGARIEQRVQQAFAKQRLGIPLSRQLAGPGPENMLGQEGTMAQHALLGISPIVILASIWILWQESGIPATIAGYVLLLLGLLAGAVALRARIRAWRMADADKVSPAFDTEMLSQLDHVLELIAPQVPPDTLTHLSRIKATLVRISPLLGQNRIDENFTLEDKLYITECVRRYLPDSLQAFLQVPAHLRAEPMLENGESAQVVLDQQLELFQSELLMREGYLNQGAGEQLQRQQRFLHAKHN